MLFVQNLKLQVLQFIFDETSYRKYSGLPKSEIFYYSPKGIDWESAGEILDHEERQRLC